MANIFLEYFRRNRFVFGILISLITSILVIITSTQFADLVIKDWIFLPITGIVFFLFMILYTKIIEERKGE